MAAADRSAKDKQRASYLKMIGEERRQGKCPVCYAYMPNYTFGGSGAMQHMSQHARGYAGKKDK